MEYTTTLSSSGQITLPKAIRECLKIDFGDKVSLHLAQDKVELKRTQGLDEILDEIDRETPPDVRAEIERRAGQTAGDYREEWLRSPQAKNYYTNSHPVDPQEGTL